MEPFLELPSYHTFVPFHKLFPLPEVPDELLFIL